MTRQLVLSTEQAEELAGFRIPAAPDVRMPSCWVLSVAGVPVPPVPDMGTSMFSRAIALYREGLMVAQRANPLYAPNIPEWLRLLEDQHAERMAAYDGLFPPVRHNNRLWHGRTYKEFVASFHAGAALGGGGGRGGRGGGCSGGGGGRGGHFGGGGGHVGGGRGRGFGGGSAGPFGGGGGSVRLGGGGSGGAVGSSGRVSVCRGGVWGVGSAGAGPSHVGRVKEEVKEEPEGEEAPEPALVDEYRRLAAEAGDPDGTSGFLEAIRASQMALMLPPLVVEYHQFAPIAGRPKDPDDFPGYQAAIDDSL